MAILSKRLMADVGRMFTDAFGLRPRFIDLSGRALQSDGDPLGGLATVRRRRDYGLQESINTGMPHHFWAVPGVAAWVVGLEDRRMVHGGLAGPEVRVAATDEGTGGGRLPPSAGAAGAAAETLAAQGMGAADAEALLAALPEWPAARITEAAAFMQETFYAVSGWKPTLMRENRLRGQQQEQINRAIEDRRQRGQQALYAFEKERMLLANIRAGDRNGARRLLNEMLAAIYMSSPQLVVLRARAVELMSCLTRAAIEDNPLLEPLIERNHAWTEQLVHAEDFEDLSYKLMQALDEFIDGIYLHGVNRSNEKVRQALEFIRREYATPLSLGRVAAEVGLSPFRLSHVVKQYTGRTVIQIVHEVRVRQAQQLLDRSDRGCADIAYEVGFGDQSHFIRQFRRVTGTTPARYRRSRRT